MDLLSMGTDRYVEGFIAGQAVAYCERVRTGMSLAAQLECPMAYREMVQNLAAEEGCKVLDDSGAHTQASLWIYRDELVPRLIAEMKSAHAPSEFAMWSMGRLLGYANHDVAGFIDRAR